MVQTSEKPTLLTLYLFRILILSPKIVRGKESGWKKFLFDVIVSRTLVSMIAVLWCLPLLMSYNKAK